ncbi:glutamate racemase [Acetonema longum]|uniref:Glutamate racemase n=1 Tax=Acetonema longum DSM 6540 TaxID=1009370 RepID=F7NE45_9FIRM|nr:glutamate racemase [Acetonema longum]EGO65700.1 glutamate racemase [Acetonema longum DSM 6540]
MKIGIFDSGVGGITVLAEALKELPREDYLYYADTKHVPYGEKPKEIVHQYIFEAVEQMIAGGIKALVLACNTATSIAADSLRAKYPFPVLGMEPAVKPAVLKNDDQGRRVLVFATTLTLKESKFQHLVARVDQHHIVDFLPLPELVEFAETQQFDPEVVVPCLRQKLSQLDLAQYGTVVLGCTHFPFFTDHLRQVLPAGVDIIDGAAGTVRHLKNVLTDNDLLEQGQGQVTFNSSGDRQQDAARFARALDLIRSLR